MPRRSYVIGGSFLIFALYFLAFKEEKSELINFECGRFPEENHITFDNVVWQVLELPGGKFVKIMNAYLEERRNLSIVKINAVSRPLYINVDTIYCQFWYGKDTQPYIVKAFNYQMQCFGCSIDFFMMPYIIECLLPKSTKILPTSVSLVADSCDHAENNLKIIDNKPVDGKKGRLAVLSKAATFPEPEFAFRFIEWVHWMLIMGAEKIYFSYRYLHPKMFEAVKYFESQGIVEAWPYYEPSGIAVGYRNQHILMEQNCLNDVFYRTMNLYEYVAILDFDEIIMPLAGNDRNYFDLIARYNNTGFDYIMFESFVFAHNVTEPENVPSHLHTLRKTFYFTPSLNQGKSICKTENVHVAHNHYPIFCLSGYCNKVAVPENEGKVFHYRDNIVERLNCTMHKVTTLDKYKDELIKNVGETLEALKARENATLWT